MRKTLYPSVLLLVVTLMGCKSKPVGTPDNSTESGNAAAKTAGEIVISTQEQSAQHIQVSTVVLRSESRMLSVPGRITLPDNAMWRVGVLTTGRIAVVSANLGDYVHKGQVLAKMHSHDTHEARADYQTALSNRLRTDAARDLAQREYERTNRLYALKAASVEQVETAHQELLNAEAESRNVEIAVQRERTHLEDTLGIPADIPPNSKGEENELIPIVAPADGYVLQKNVTIGSTIDPTADAFTIGNLSRLWMLASVGEKDLPLLQLRERAEVTIPGSSTAIIGTLTNLGQQFDVNTRKMEIRIEVPNTGNRLRPEMLAEASLPLGRSEPALRVPQQAVQQVSGQDAVFIRTAADRFMLRFVHTGPVSDSMVEIVEGLHEGEQVVTQGSFIVKSELLRSTIGD